MKKRLNDSTLKTLLIILVSIFLIPIYFMWNSLSNFQDKISSIIEKQKVIIIDSSGNNFVTNLKDNKIDVLAKLGTTIMKKQLSFDYLNYKDNLNYFRIYSSNKAYSKWLKLFQKINGDIDIIKTSYKINLKNYVILYDKTKKEYILYMLVDQYKTSSTKANIANKLLITYEIVSGNPTPTNNIGIYVKDFTIKDLKEVDNEELKRIFGDKF